jgi:hypothetical protein
MRVIRYDTPSWHWSPHDPPRHICKQHENNTRGMTANLLFFSMDPKGGGTPQTDTQPFPGLSTMHETIVLNVTSYNTSYNQYDYADRSRPK